MAREVQVHETGVLMVKTATTQLYAGANIALKVKVSCSLKCNLQGGKIRIADDEGAVVKEIELGSFAEVANETDEFVVKAPSKPGEYTWTAVFAARGHEGILHEGSSVPFSFVVKSHTTGMAVWDVPSPVVFNTRFKIKVGVQCSAECKLAGKQVGIYDHQGAKVATGTLGDVRWSDTGALYWAEVEVQAPGTEGYYTWEAKFPTPDLELPHEEASYTFAFRTASPPEHMVTVEVHDKNTATPMKHAEVILHPYRDYTDERGMARLRVPKGDYELYVSASDMKIFQTTVKVASDLSVRADLLVAPPVEDNRG